MYRDEESMESNDLILLVRRRLALILILVTLGFSIAYYQTSKITPMYASTATIFVSTPPTLTDPLQVSGNKLGDLATGNNFTQARIKSYATIINNVSTLAPVIADLKLKISPTELANRVSAVSPPNTVLMYVKVIDQDPILAAKIANSVANHFSATVLEIELNANNDSSKIIRLSLVQDATPNFTPVSPKKFFNYLLGIFFGLFFGLALSLFLRFLDKSMKSERDLGQTSLLGVVAFDPEASDKPLIKSLGNYAVRTEAFRVLRTNLLHLLDSNTQNTLTVTSCFSGEGKTTATLNLGFVISQAGFRVIIVEADMRRPAVVKYVENLGVDLGSHSYGLSDLLRVESKVKLRRKINSAITEVPDTSLDLLLSGKSPQNPSELLGGDRFVELIDDLSKQYDYVLIDTPPVLAVADASIVSRVTQTVLLLIHAGSTSKRNFVAAREAILSVGVELTGAVLNKVPKHKAGEHYGYTYADPAMGYYRYNYDYKPDSEMNKEILSKKARLKVTFFEFMNTSRKKSPTVPLTQDEELNIDELIKKYSKGMP
jgi:polysaccharide biosynthesis transport protein